MKKIALTLISCVLFSVMSAQSVDIQGILIDSVTQNPVMYANVGIVEKSLGTVSDENGRFSLAVPDSLARHDLTISRIGYQKMTIAINSFGKRADTLLLVPEIYELQEVTVSVGKCGKGKSDMLATKWFSFRIMPDILATNLEPC